MHFTMAGIQGFSSCAVVFLLLLVPHACMATTTLQYKCEKYAAGTQSDYDFCMKTMEADKASATADARGLAVIAARIGRAMANATEGKIEAELRGLVAGAVPATRDCLAACAVEYAATARRLRHAASVAAGLAGGGATELREVQALLAKAYGPAAVCDAKFANAGLPGSSAISAVDRKLDDVIGMAIAFLPITSTRTKP